MQVGSLIPGEVVRHPELTDTDRIIFGLLFQFRRNNCEVFASNSWIAKTVDKSTRTVQRSIKKMITLGLIRARLQPTPEGTKRHLEIVLGGAQMPDSEEDEATPVSQDATSMSHEATPVSPLRDTSVTHNKRSLINSISIDKLTELLDGDLPEHVRLKDRSVESLLKEMSQQELRYWVFVLDSYIPNAKKPYKDHAAAIRTFRRNAIEQGKQWNGKHYSQARSKSKSPPRQRQSSSAFADEYFAQQSSEDMSDAIDVT